MVEALYISHLVYSAELDIMNPQNHEYATKGNHSNNKNVLNDINLHIKSGETIGILGFTSFGSSFKTSQILSADSIDIVKIT